MQGGGRSPGDASVDEVTEGQIVADAPAAAPAQDPEGAQVSERFRPGRVISNRYRIERPIARGGMGRVYLATQMPLGRQVALKVLTAQGASKEFRGRFLLEASTCARLVHKHIVTVHDYGETEHGDLFMAMEYLNGEPLSKAITKSLRLPGERTARIALQICRALRAAHVKGIVHRDLKPSNVMLMVDEHGEETGHRGGDLVKVLDFGLVKAFETGLPKASSEQGDEIDLTRAGTLLGSPRYMSPEQIRCEPVGPPTDVYSLGVIMFHMLAGRPPFIGSSSVEILNQHLKEPAPPVSAFLGGADEHPELEVIIARCLEKAPANRYPSMDELIADLRAAFRLITGLTIGSESMVDHAGEDGPTPHRRDSLDAPPLGTSSSPDFARAEVPSSPPAAPPPPPLRSVDQWPATHALGPTPAMVPVIPAPRSMSGEAAAQSPAPAAVRGTSAKSAAPFAEHPRASSPAPQITSLDQDELTPRGSSGRAKLYIAGAALASIVGGMIAVFGTARDPPPANPPAVERAAPAKEVEIAFASNPAGAEVMFDGRVLGKTPVTVTLPRDASGGEKRFIFRLEGHMPETVKSALDRDSMSLFAALREEKPAVAEPPAEPSAKAPAVVAEPARTQPRRPAIRRPPPPVQRTEPEPTSASSARTEIEEKKPASTVPSSGVRTVDQDKRSSVVVDRDTVPIVDDRVPVVE